MTTASIIVVNHNYGRYLGEALDSALAQTRTAEVIVVDDGSTDDSRDVIARFGDRVEAVLKPNEGQASAFNAGYARCRGDVVVFLDSDDLLEPNAVGQVMPSFEADADLVKVHWPLAALSADGRREMRIARGARLCEGSLRDDAVAHGPLSGFHAPTSGNAWSRGFLERVMPVLECGDRHGADAYLCTLAEIYGPIRRLSTPLGFYREHGSNYSGKGVRFRLERNLRRHDHHSRVLSAHLAAVGIAHDPAAWSAPGTTYAWAKQALRWPQRVSEVLPPGGRFVLIDQDEVGCAFFEQHEAIPFVERNGRYFGPPGSDLEAATELRRHLAAGAQAVAITSHSDWWLEAYPSLRSELMRHFPSTSKSDGLRLFSRT